VSVGVNVNVNVSVAITITVNVENGNTFRKTFGNGHELENVQERSETLR
jgi:hypothetical protein